MRFLALAVVAATVLQPSTASARTQFGSSLQIFVEPGAQDTPVVSLIAQARHSVRLEVYILTSRTIIADLASAKRRGIDVRVLLEHHPVGATHYANLAFQELQQAGVPVRWANETSFTLTHAKSLEIDGRIAGIFTFNLSLSAFSGNREFGVIDSNPADARAVASIIDGDWNRVRPSYSDSSLVVSPHTSRADFDRIIQRARHTLDIYAEEVNDSQVEYLLGQAVKRHVRVRLITSQSSAGVDSIGRGGVHVHIMSTPYVHAKAIVADGKTLFVGSENISTTSLDDNREIGLLINSATKSAVVERTFTSDWSASYGAGPPPPPVPPCHPEGDSPFA